MDTRPPLVKEWSPETDREYTLFIAAAGYEQRSRFIAETLKINAVSRRSFMFLDRRTLEFDKNVKILKALGHTLDEPEEDEFATWCNQVLSEITAPAGEPIAVAIDISSLSRFRIATLIDATRRAQRDRTIVVDFLYSLAKYSAPPSDLPPNRHVGPVLDAFAGWNDEPDQPPVAILGLGYEQDRALGAVEHLQAADVFAFIPTSRIPQYSRALLTANTALLDRVPEDCRIPYTVERPLDCFARLEALTHGCAQSQAPILLPFGPKIFTVAALLVACIHPSVAVWRVSPGETEAPMNRKPNGTVCGLRAVFPSSPPQTDYDHLGEGIQGIDSTTRRDYRLER
jgi:hypothetical protein